MSLILSKFLIKLIFNSFYIFFSSPLLKEENLMKEYIYELEKKRMKTKSDFNFISSLKKTKIFNFAIFAFISFLILVISYNIRFLVFEKIPENISKI